MEMNPSPHRRPAHRFGDDLLPPLVSTVLRQELLGSECALHGEALRLSGAQASAGAGEPKVVQYRSDKQQFLVESMLPFLSEDGRPEERSKAVIDQPGVADGGE